MHRVSKAVAVASLLVALTTSNIYAIPSNGGSQPSLRSKIIKLSDRSPGWIWDLFLAPPVIRG